MNLNIKRVIITLVTAGCLVGGVVNTAFASDKFIGDKIIGDISIDIPKVELIEINKRVENVLGRHVHSRSYKFKASKNTTIVMNLEPFFTSLNYTIKENGTNLIKQGGITNTTDVYFDVKANNEYVIDISGNFGMTNFQYQFFAFILKEHESSTEPSIQSYKESEPNDSFKEANKVTLRESKLVIYAYMNEEWNDEDHFDVTLEKNGKVIVIFDKSQSPFTRCSEFTWAIFNGDNEIAWKEVDENNHKFKVEFEGKAGETYNFYVRSGYNGESDFNPKRSRYLVIINQK